MREIKFRAWDKEAGRFTDEVADWETLITLDGRMSPYPPKQNIVLLQYTGLKDKNGLEIYEGDVVRCYGGTENEIVGDIYWFKGGFNVRTVDTFWSPAEKDWEIVGNIY